MLTPRIPAILLLAATFPQIHAQTPVPSPATQSPAAAAPTFEVADIHPSPHSNSPQTSISPVVHGRYTIHQATMSTLIATAYSVGSSNVTGGPAWLDLDRYDVTGKTPNNTSYDNARLMLRALLVDRFHLVARTGEKPLPAFVLTAPKPRLKAAADSAAPANCEYKQPPPNTPQTADFAVTFSCHNVTMKYLADFLHNTGRPYVKNPAVDHTGLTGGYDFDIHWTYTPPVGDAPGTTLFAALDQLGLKLEAGTAPLPVVLVESVDETPTPNPPGIEKALPPLPPMSFDVATIKPSAPDAKGLNLQLRGSEIVISNATLEFLITWSWDIAANHIADPPDFLQKDHWDILGKFSSDEPPAGPGQNPNVSLEDVQQMLQSLLTDRFELKTHTEDRPTDAWSLVAAAPHMKAAEPGTRTGCKTGPGPDGKDPRIANPVLGRLVYCQNMTMTQFADQLQSMASGYIKGQVIDATGVQGSYDFLLSFSTAGQLRGTPQPAAEEPAPAASGGALAVAPTGGLSLFDALPKEIGVKLEKRKGTQPMLIIDHLDPKPTDN